MKQPNTVALDKLAAWAEGEAKRRAAEQSDAVKRAYVEGGIMRVTEAGLTVIPPEAFYAEPPAALTCSRCGKKLSRKTARQIDGKPLCSACLFPPLKGGLKV